MNESYTWVPLYREIAEKLLDWEHRQSELIALLEQLRQEGVVILPLIDQNAEGQRFLLKEIDPFTFFASFNRGIQDKQRRAILERIKEVFHASSQVPTDFFGIPIANNMQTWFIGYQNIRTIEDIPLLWKVFRLALAKDPLSDPEFSKAFDQALEIWGISVNLTMGLFWIRPDLFLNLDSINRKYLKLKLPPGGLSSKYYLETIKNVRAKHKSFVELSHEAWLGKSKDGTSSDDLEDPNISYWLVGAQWQSSDPQDQLPRFIEQGIWENGYDDHYLDQVKSIKVGDRIAVKSSCTQKKNLPFDAQGKTISLLPIKARGTVVANHHNGKSIQVEWDETFEPKNWYFFTNRSTIWKLRTDNDYPNARFAKELISFIWHNKPQNYEWFLKAYMQKEIIPDPDDHLDSGIPFSVEDMLDAGVFMTKSEIDQIIDRLKVKKNLILQGAPGVGKTFIARMLSYALIEERDPARIQFVQFHQTFSYEDFVRGYRPLAGDGGKFGLQDAIFFKFCKLAREDRDRQYVLIVDEINRGNISQIFGELLMLIEADKRKEEFAVELVYNQPGEDRFYIPENLHIIGLMNVADRSLALVDYALRRRFAFVTLAPKYESVIFRNWLLERRMDGLLVDRIIQKMCALNNEISSDPLLGENYQIGHSIFCPSGSDFSTYGNEWFDSIVKTEIEPLLKEYWHDNKQKVHELCLNLLAN